MLAILVIIKLMLQLSSKLFNIPIMSLRSGGPVGTAVSPVINPNNLKIEGWYAVDRFSGKKLVLPVSEVRELTRRGLAVNDHDAMTDPTEMVRLKKVIEIDYQLLGKMIITEKHRKVGKITDFAFEPESMYIQNLYARGRGLRSLASDELVIGRGQIVQITDKAIVVRDTDVSVSFAAKVAERATGRQTAPI